MSSTFGFLIRDGLESDIGRCLAVDHTYETDYVWQMTTREEGDEREVRFKKDRLPRTMQSVYPYDEHHIRMAIPSEHCFLVAVERDQSEILGYMTMHNDPLYHVARVTDLVVSRPYRNHRIATRLLNISRQWAREYHLTQMTMELQTKNYPGILFCQRHGFAFCGFNDRLFPDQDIAVFFSQALR
jgi:GNAT superfamily N-acetyltransferase